MTDTKSTYVRMPVTLGEKIDEYKKVHGLTMSEAVCNLIEFGLLHAELNRKVEQLSTENFDLKVKKETTQGELLQCQSQLGAAQNSIRGLISMIQMKVAKCKNCSTQMSLQDLVLRKCSNCGGSSFDLLDEYKGQVTGLQSIERFLAIVGGIYLASQVLGDNQ